MHKRSYIISMNSENNLFFIVVQKKNCFSLILKTGGTSSSQNNFVLLKSYVTNWVPIIEVLNLSSET